MTPLIFDMTLPKIGDFLLLTPALKKVQECYREVYIHVPEPLERFYKKQFILSRIITSREVGELLQTSRDATLIDVSYPHLEFTPRHTQAQRLKKEFFQGDQHVSQMYYEALRDLLPALPESFEFFPFLFMELDPKKLALFDLTPFTYLTIHMGSDFLPKNWGDEKFERLIWSIANKYNDLKIVGLFGPKDNEIFQENEAPANFIPIRTRIERVADILTGSLFHIDNDSGINHLAGALDVPTISIWGFTAPGTWAPLSTQQYTLWGGPSCANHCFGGRALECVDRICLNAIKVSDVMPAVDEIMENYKIPVLN